MGGEPSRQVHAEPLDMGSSQLGAYESKRSIHHHPVGKHLCGVVSISNVGNSISAIHEDIGTINDYVLGTKGAKTTVRWPGGEKALTTGQTQGQMHSEMEAVKFMLDQGHWIMVNGEIFTKAGGRVAPTDFVTGEMHCGWCTLFLQLLGLPLGSPSDGNFKLAINLLYPLPAQVRNSPHVMFKLVFGGEDDSVKSNRILNLKLVFDKFMTIPCTHWYIKDFSGMCIASDTSSARFVDPSGLGADACIFTWDHLFGSAELLDSIWKHIYDGIYKKFS
ncbi:hypothetical protein ASG87_06720 [Frateuria sp. Soil773]|nr:hypothetical protein ASG87_06720 [Frateuria sp. Soil773]